MTLKIVENAIYELIKDITLTGNSEPTPVFALRAPDKQEAPFIIFQRVDSERWRSIAGPAGIAQAYIQIDCYTNEYYEAKTLGAAVEDILDGYRNTVYYGDNSPQDSIEIAGITLQNDVDLLDEDDEPHLFRNSARYLITYKQ